MTNHLDPSQIQIDGDVAYVVLSLKQRAIIDAEDVPMVSDRHWGVRCSGTTSKVYVDYTVTKNRRMTRVPMANVILGCEGIVDHVNGDPLDNRKQNLRPASRLQNAQNARRPPGASGYRGVRRDGKLWRAGIKVDGKEKYLGSFPTPLEAAIAYNHAARQYHGDFAVLNEVPDAQAQ